VIIHAVAPNYFQVLRMHLLAGRAFNPRDTASSPRVTIINRNAARDLFGSENPIGKVLEFVADERRGVPGDAPVQIIGVAENAQEFGPDEVPFNFLFVPFAQHPVPSAFVLLASDVPRGDVARGIRATAYALDKDQPVFDMETMDDRIANSLQGARFNLFLVAALASVALILVSVGTFGTVAYFVQQRNTGIWRSPCPGSQSRQNFVSRNRPIARDRRYGDLAWCNGLADSWQVAPACALPGAA
jgi:putative ABC transport system permease protein